MRHLFLTLLAAAVLGGCDLSNELFEEDALFLRAVPSNDDVRTEHPGSRAEDGTLVDDEERGDEDTPAVIPPQARETARWVNQFVFSFLVSLEWVMDQPITTRSRDRRIWGPLEDDAAGGWYRLVVERSADAPDTFLYSLEVSDDGEAWSELMGGDFTRGAKTVLRGGEGSFCWDADLSASRDGGDYGGLMCVDHARDGGEVTLSVVFHDWLDETGQRTRFSYFFHHVPDEGGVLEYATTSDFLGGGDGLRETSATRVRWQHGGAGRADLRMSGGSLLGSEVAASECWDATFAQTWWLVDHQGGEFDEERGDEASCVYAEREEVREL